MATTSATMATTMERERLRLSPTTDTMAMDIMAMDMATVTMATDITATTAITMARGKPMPMLTPTMAADTMDTMTVMDMATTMATTVTTVITDTMVTVMATM